MNTVIFQIFGAISFLIATVILGIILRRNPIKSVAEKTSRISHFFYYFGLVLPASVGFISPGLTHFDEIIGVNSLPFKDVTFIIGVLITAIGTYFTFASIKNIKNIGQGAPAFKLTKIIVINDIYKHCRNPMSLGYYLLCIGVSFMSGSTYLVIGSINVSILHIFNLIFFEELELEIRYEESYKDYKKNTPFLIPKLMKTKG